MSTTERSLTKYYSQGPSLLLTGWMVINYCVAKTQPGIAFSLWPNVSRFHGHVSINSEECISIYDWCNKGKTFWKKAKVANNFQARVADWRRTIAWVSLWSMHALETAGLLPNNEIHPLFQSSVHHQVPTSNQVSIPLYYMPMVSPHTRIIDIGVSHRLDFDLEPAIFAITFISPHVCQGL